MKHFYLFFLNVFLFGICLAQDIMPPPNGKIKPVNRNIGVKWNDSLFKHLPKGIDTSIILKDSKDNALSFRQYVVPVFNHEAMIFHDRGTWRLHRLTKEAYDSLARNDDVVARWERVAAYRDSDAVTSWKVKLNAIAHTLASADHILVLKSQRKMILTRKGKFVTSFTIDMGFNPIGAKLTDGDGKTPEGIYNIDMKWERGDKFYKSFWITYPNEADKLAAKEKGVKTGYSILIHGTTKSKVNAKDWTAGCIALQNKDMDKLFDLVNSGTIIEIRK